jgi:hypothetical protein
MNSKANDAFMAKLAVQNSKRIDQLTNVVGAMNNNFLKTCTLNATITRTGDSKSIEATLTGTIPTLDNCKHFLGLRTGDIATDASYSTFYRYDEGVDGFGCSYNETGIVLDANYINGNGSSAAISFCEEYVGDFNFDTIQENDGSISGTIHFDFI